MSLPFGLRDVKVAPIAVDGTIGTMVDLANGQTLSFSESEDFTELRGDDRVVAKRGNGPTVSWELDSGGITLEALVIMNGGTLTISGVAPAVVRKYSKKGSDSKPDFWCEGQAISESGGDFHLTLHQCKADDSFEGELTDGDFWVSKASGSAIATEADDLYDFTENATAVAIAQPS